VGAVRCSLPELPDAKRDRFVAQYGLRSQDAAVLTVDQGTADYYEAAVTAAGKYDVDARVVANWVIGELFRLTNAAELPLAQSPVTAQALAHFLDQVEHGAISANAGKRVLAEMLRTGRSAGAIIEELGLAQIQDRDTVRETARQVVRDQPDAVSQYLEGKSSVLGFLIGQAMRASQGRANPQLLRRAIQEELDGLRGS
jgi:aspartyl-tRNA(Asn)/glutamyl-tRNA(Gln) amidotransferase subunit B